MRRFLRAKSTHPLRACLKTMGESRTCVLTIDILCNLERGILLEILKSLTSFQFQQIKAPHASGFLDKLAGSLERLQQDPVTQACFLQLVALLGRDESVTSQYLKCTVDFELHVGHIEGGLLHAFAERKLEKCFDALLEKLSFQIINEFLYFPGITEIDEDGIYRNKAIAHLQKHHVLPDVNHIDHNTDTMLHHAVKRNDLHWVRALLSHGANPNISNRNGVTPLHLAMHHTVSVDILKLLLQGDGLNFQQIDLYQHTPFDRAMQAFNEEKMEILIDRGLFNDFSKDEYERHWLHRAAGFGYAAALRYLFQMYDVQHWRDRLVEPDINGNTPLHFSVLSGNLQVVEALLKQARPGMFSKNGYSIESPLCNLVNASGQTPLHQACRMGKAHLVVILSTINNVHMRDKYGKTPLDYAKDHGYLHAIARLEDADLIRCLEEYLRKRLEIGKKYKGRLDGLFGGSCESDKFNAVVQIIDAVKAEDYCIDALKDALPKAAKQGLLHTILNCYFNGELLEKAWFPEVRWDISSLQQLNVSPS